MIIELFGPPGSGKTTFACALAARLRASGHVVELVISCRPAERPTDNGNYTAVSPHLSGAAVRRTAHAIAETIMMARHPLANLHDVSTALQVVRTLPPHNPIWSIKLIQYLSRLSHSWYHAAATGNIVVFDQGYVQIVSSLAVLARYPSHGALARALEIAPKSNLLIRLDAPRDVLTARLRERYRLQDAIERLLEFDLKRNFQTIEVIDRLHDLLREGSYPVICASSLDARSLCEGVERVEQQLTAREQNAYPPNWQ